jgi:hypothetical protein
MSSKGKTTDTGTMESSHKKPYIPPESHKKPYTPPQLTEYGDVAKLTAAKPASTADGSNSILMTVQA